MMRRQGSTTEELFRLVSENVADHSIILLDADGTVVSWTEAARNIEGYAPEEILGRDVAVLMTAEDIAAGIPQKMLDAAAREGHVEAEGWRVRSDGSRYWANVVITASHNEAGELTGFVRIARDMSERQRATEAQRAAETTLRASEERFRRIVETAGEGIGIRDINGRMTFANERFAAMLGYTVDEVLQKNVFDLVAPQHRRLLEESAERRRISGKGEQLDIEFQRKDGSHVAVILHSSPLYDGDGNYVGALGMLTDITERKQLEDQLRQSQKIEAVGRLAGGIAHDFNNLLTAIRGHVELLLSELPSSMPLYSDVEEIRKAADRAASLTHQLLAFSRRQILQPRVLEIDQVVGDMDTLFRRLIGEDIRLITRLESHARIRADRGQIEQVLLNLAVNARDAMPHGGSLIIETHALAVDEEFVRTHEGARPGRYVHLVVTDTGFGMNPDTLSHVFEPFFTTKELGKGTGLGLATVYGIVKQSGGYIGVQSEPESGTSFSILLPLVEEGATTQKAARTDGGVQANGETVLVAEDEDAVRSLASRILRKRGYNVLEARHGAEALEIAERHDGEIHLLLTDVVMPALGGRELGERLQHMRPQVKVLFMSGYTDDALLQHGVLQGSGSFLEKPFTPDGLVSKVREVLESH